MSTPAMDFDTWKAEFYPCVTCGKDSDQYADIGREGYECEECYESGIES